MTERIIRSNKIRTEDISLSYHIKKATEKERRTIIFLHGFPFNKNSWRPQLESLEDDITGIAIDVRGHGLSTSGHGFFSIDVFAKDIIAFINKLDIEKVTLCGVSMGGYIALRMYQLIPDRIEGLILSDTHSRADDNTAKQKRFDSIQAILRHGRRPFALGFIDSLFAPKTILENPEAVELIKSSIRRNPIQTICATMLALASRTDTSDLLANIKVPTLLIRGTEDKITAKFLMEEMHQCIPKARYIEIEEAGHLPNLEQPLAFNKEINAFLLT
ncbi:alpha/beta fold hydrolase [Sphingobacterium faecale]|uniref:Alpha/beta fold hydrolase n=1 Tax=Sphingobacterium faecale TaxID=2803775 RepID=A0ABS1R3A2_9SPHI|nr:alpha/beta fold hydrolase [Sphingobacterium faecale]MBL1408356.1 alpha/beta fold hydrolase [Sphingobacterium faecale]